MSTTIKRPAPAHSPLPNLAAPPRYFPFESGRYEVKPGLHRLGTDFGNGSADEHVFQIDRHWTAYRGAKLSARAENLAKYVCRRDMPAPLEAALARWMIHRLTAEHPSLFARTQINSGATTLHNRLAGEKLVFDSRSFMLIEVHTPQRIEPPYASALDALACQVQEDLALVEIDADGGNRLCALHLCFPNHWAACDKIGKPFSAVHQPVPHMQRINRHARSLMTRLTERGPFVRFAWGLATDQRLNHHPEPPPDHSPGQWTGRRFDTADPGLYVRIERQVTVGFPEYNAFLFTIRTYFEDVTALPDNRLAQLQAAIASLSPAALSYKGLERDERAIMAWLSGLRRH